jgi:hypothetical protein
MIIFPLSTFYMFTYTKKEKMNVAPHNNILMAAPEELPEELHEKPPPSHLQKVSWFWAL